jgi:hypothetical protein
MNNSTPTLAATACNCSLMRLLNWMTRPFGRARKLHKGSDQLCRMSRMRRKTMLPHYDQNVNLYPRQKPASHPGSFRLYGCWSHHSCLVDILLLFRSEMLTVNIPGHFGPAKTRYSHSAYVLSWLLIITIIF